MTKSTSLAADLSAIEAASDDCPNVSPPVLFLEICRGRTGFPCRPILQNRFLIGADAACDLRLGGDDMPPLHSIIRCDGRDVQLETIAALPALKVNGTIEQSVRLADGDLIEIGCFQFLAHQPDAAACQTGSESMPQDLLGELDGDFDAEAFDEQSLEDLTASELVELIEQEEALIEQLEDGRRMGADALMHAVRQRAGAPDGAVLGGAEPDVVHLPDHKAAEQSFGTADTASQSRATGIKPLIAAAGKLELELLQDLEQALLQLNVISQELDQRAQRLSRREASYAEAAEQLLDAQQQLATHLESLVDQLPERQPAPTRAIA